MALELHSRDPHPETGAFLLDTLVAFDMPVTDHPGIRATIRQAAESTRRHHELTGEQKARLERFFAEQGAEEIARIFREPR